MFVAQAAVVILTSRSLFAEGIAARLRQDLPVQDVTTIDARQPDALNQVIAAQPGAVIVDITDREVMQLAPMWTLLAALPALKIIRIHPDHDHIQIVTSEQREAGRVQDLIEIIQSS
jgi:hypothetical protein